MGGGGKKLWNPLMVLGIFLNSYKWHPHEFLFYIMALQGHFPGSALPISEPMIQSGSLHQDVHTIQIFQFYIQLEPLVINNIDLMSFRSIF